MVIVTRSESPPVNQALVHVLVCYPELGVLGGLLMAGRLLGASQSVWHAYSIIIYYNISEIMYSDPAGVAQPMRGSVVSGLRPNT